MKKLINFNVDLHEYEKFKQNVSCDAISFYDKTKELSSLNLSEAIQKLLKRYLEGEIKLNFDVDIKSNHKTQRGINLDIDVWRNTMKYIIDKIAEGNPFEGKMNELIVRLIYFYNVEFEKLNAEKNTNV